MVNKAVANPELATKCSCADPQHCKPITGPPTAPKEVFGFVTTSKWESTMNWTHVTTVAWASSVCEAHKNGARVVMAAPSVPFNATADERRQWVTGIVEAVEGGGFDGVTFDFESPLAAGSKQVEEYTAAVRAARDGLHTANPSYQVSVCVGWSPDAIDGRAYDYKGLSEASDVLFVMDYDTRSQITTQCIASANAPLPGAILGMQHYMNLGIPASKLVLGVPWYGYRYECLAGTPPDSAYCPIPLKPFRGVNCSDAAGSEVGYTSILDKATGPNVTRALSYDSSMMAPYFNVIEEGKVVQYWFDDAKSLTLKYEWAKSAGLKGVGPYTFDYAVPSKHTAETLGMWSSIDAFVA